MNKQAFLFRLQEALSGLLPQEALAERLAFYGEMIDDRVEEGLSEEAAVAEIGSPEEVFSRIAAELPLSGLIRERMKPKRRLRAWEIVLLALGSPLWLSLLIAAFAVLLSVFVVIWAVIVSLWAAELSLVLGAVGGAAAGVLLLCLGSRLTGVAFLSAAPVLAGLSIFLFFGCLAAGRGAVRLTKKIAGGFKSLLVKKEKAE